MPVLPGSGGSGTGPQFDNPGYDAFGRFRVSDNFALFDTKQIFDNQPLFWDDQQVSGAGTTSTFSSAKARSRLSVAGTTAGKRVRQSFQRFNYQPGRSHLVVMTGVLGVGVSGLTQGIGYHDDDNGVFFRCKDAVLQTVVRSSASGSAVDTAVAQSAWNLDTMDGNGPSEITIDLTKTQIFLIDFEWLGVGRVRFGFVVDGLIYYCHEYKFANSGTEVYMSTPNLPLRYEIENDGTAAASNLDVICSVVSSEGGQSENGALRYKSTSGTNLDANVENTLYAVLGIRLKSTHLGATINLQTVSIAEHQGTKEFEWLLLFNPTVAGTFTYADEIDSAVQTAVGVTANTVTGGRAITGQMGSSAQKGGFTQSSSLDSNVRLGSSISGTVDTIVLCVRPIGGSTNIDIEGALGWRELS